MTRLTAKGVCVTLILLVSFSLISSTSRVSSATWKTFAQVERDGNIMFKLEYGIPSDGYRGKVRWRVTNLTSVPVYDVNLNSRTYKLSDGSQREYRPIYMTSIIRPGDSYMPTSDYVNPSDFSSSSGSRATLSAMAINEPMVLFKVERGARERVSWGTAGVVKRK